LVVGIIILLISICVIPSTGTIIKKQNINQISNNGNTLYVGGNGPGNYTRIQDAINDSNNDDTVFVYNDSSPYIEDLMVNKSISLVGEDRDSTIIDGWREAVYITADYVNVTGFNIRCGDTGIFIHGGRYSNISDNLIDTYYYGIEIWNSDSSFCVISQNIIIMAGWWGIYLASGSKNVISDNTIICTFYSQQFGSNGIFVDKSSSSNKFINNKVSGCDFSIYSKNNIVMNNTIDNSGRGILLTGLRGVTIQCRNNIISGNIISNSDRDKGWGTGIHIRNFARNNIISGNILMNNEIGVFISVSNSNKILNNNFINNTVNAELCLFCFYNKWRSNYWDDWIGLEYRIFRFIPYPILGTLGINKIQWVNFDWRPAKEPYDI
jgi:parallel beta-helix repeat protein